MENQVGSVKLKLIFLRPFKKCRDFSLNKVRRPRKLILVFFIIPVLAFIVGRIIYLTICPPTYIFSLSASSSLVIIETPKEPAPIKWRINDASVCTQYPYFTPYKIFVLANPSSKDCGEGWYKYDINDTELTLEIYGHSTSIFEKGENNTLYLSVRSANSDANQQTSINITVNNNDTFPIGSKVNLIWRDNKNRDYLVFPFLGTVTVGGDINWSSHGMLDSGTIGIYSSDFSLANNRKQLDKMELMLGDKVTLGNYGQKTKDTSDDTKGFLRYYQSSNDKSPELNVVGFGESSLVNVERYGENGIAYKPSFWSQLLADAWLIVALSMIGVAATLAQLFDFLLDSKHSDTD